MKEHYNSKTEMFYPGAKNIKIYPPNDLCDANSLKKLYIKGQFNFGKKISSSSIIFKLNRTTELFHFEFIPGEKDVLHKYSVWSMTHGINRTSQTLDLVDFNKKEMEFNISITCEGFDTTGKVKVNSCTLVSLMLINDS